MPKRIRLNGFVGGELTPESVSEVFDSLDSEDIVVDLNTKGGDIYAGLEIFNRIRQYPGKKTVILGGVVASAGSYISMAFDKIVAQDISSFMIHNAQGFMFGDGDAMAKEAEELKKIDKHIANIYAKKTGKTEKEILNMMKNETWLYGQEIVDSGFAEEYTETGDEPQNKLEIQRTAQTEREFLQRVAYAKFKPENNAGNGVEIITSEEKLMDKITKEELLARLNVLKENGEISLPQIAESLGLESQVMTPEARNALDVVARINKTGVKDIEKEFARLQKVEADGKAAVRENELTTAFGPEKFKDGRENEARRYADQRYNGDIGIDDIKKDPIMVSLMAQRADYSSPQNKIGVVTGDSPTDSDGPVVVNY